jgi:hypothetical protein
VTLTQERHQLLDEAGLSGALVPDDRHQLRRLEVDRACDHI